MSSERPIGGLVDGCRTRPNGHCGGDRGGRWRQRGKLSVNGCGNRMPFKHLP
jgi:hypothetical protein